MPINYSEDLRWRAVWLHLIRKLSYAEIADILFISERSVCRYVDLYQSTGDVQPKKQRHGPEQLLNDFENITLLQCMINRPGICLAELQQQLNDITGTWVHLSTICRTVHRLGFTRKRLQHIALQCSEEQRARFKAEISIFHPSMLVWIDETGFKRRNSVRAYGYSFRGMRASDYQLRIGQKSINAIGIMSLEGIEDVYLSEENVNSDVFENFVRTTLLPVLMPFNGINSHSVVIMDNCSVHHAARGIEMISSVGALTRFLPPYSPDLNPIEEVFSKVKSFWRANDLVVQSTCTSSLRTIASMAFNTITQQDAIGYIRHSGYIF